MFRIGGATSQDRLHLITNQPPEVIHIHRDPQWYYIGGLHCLREAVGSFHEQGFKSQFGRMSKLLSSTVAPQTPKLKNDLFGV